MGRAATASTTDTSSAALMRKPGAFRNYRYIDSLFPTVVFRRAYDRLVESKLSPWRTDVEYIRILHLAATTMESLVEAALCTLMQQGRVPREDAVRELVVVDERVELPELAAPEVDLSDYDKLLTPTAGGAT